ncbi:hypothetical protein BV22DRAFT_1034680 [Leucogyrophana mollusca]|uniref:Uncharacterized protein n=1 Tax=Leucogyrophana mollusca TaxID=85980 RepID=A0ACB8BHY3_9AGAM|nr:hypothetical protein BV22DRAFT_1034680 [Leucogyrophana mollusca]
MDNFDEATQKELQTFLEKEQSQARFNASIHNIASLCWDKCVTSTPSSRFARGEESCLTNCVGRFLDTSLHLVEVVSQQRQQMASSS